MKLDRLALEDEGNVIVVGNWGGRGGSCSQLGSGVGFGFPKKTQLNKAAAGSRLAPSQSKIYLHSDLI